MKTTKTGIELTAIVEKHGGRQMIHAKNPTWISKDEQDGLVLELGILRSYRLVDMRRDFELKPSQDWQMVLDEITTQPMPEKKTEQLPATAGAVPVNAELVDQKEKKKLIVSNFDALSKQYGIPIELGNLFFVKFDEKLYIKNPGLLYIASKKGYACMQFTQKKVGEECICEYKIFPVLTTQLIEAIAKLKPELQDKALEAVTMATNGEGRASKANVKMSSMLIFLPELAQTRAQNRALRAYTGYGGMSVEELPSYETKELE